MIFSVLVLLSTLLIIYSVGFVLIATLNKTSYRTERPSFDTIYFTGFTFLSISCSYLSLFIPVNATVLGVLLVVFLALSILLRKKVTVYFTSLKQIPNHKMVFGLVSFFILLLIIALRMNDKFVYDTNLYHAQNIFWIKEYAVVPGLGNLHGRFAFNSLFFVVQALFSVEYHTGTDLTVYLYPLNLASFLVLALRQFINIYQELKSKNWKTAISYIFLCFFMFRILKHGANSPNTDVICAILVIYTFQLLIRSRLKFTGFTKLLLFSLAFTVVTYKLSSVFILLLLLPLLINTKWKSNLQLIVIIGAIVTAPFFIRNYYLSGYLVYPMAQIDVFNPEWKVPIEKVKSEACWVKSWALIPYKPCEEVNNMPMSEWIDEWLKRKKFEVFVLLISGILLFPALLFYLKKKNVLMSTVCASVVFTLLFWFFSAPDTRFILGFLIISVGIVLPEVCLLLAQIPLMKFVFANKKGLIAVSVLLLIQVFIAHKSQIELLAQEPNRLLSLPGKPKIETKQNETNFIYYSPVINDQCSHSPIPCAPYPDPKLTLRKKELKDGFKISQH